MPKINIDTNDFVDLLVSRLRKFWIDEPENSPESDTCKAFRAMWENRTESGCFDCDHDLTISEIVDNDYINNVTICSEGDNLYYDCKAAYDSGDYEVKDDNGDYVGYIEAAVNDSDNAGEYVFLISDC